MQTPVIEDLPRNKRKALHVSALRNEFGVSHSALGIISSKAREIFKQFPVSLSQPQPKVAPDLSLSQIAVICGTTRTVMKNRMSPSQLSLGQKTVDDTRELIFSNGEARALISDTGVYPSRPTSQLGKIIVFGGPHAGSGKTTSAVALARGLALRGLKVLLIDLDVQASATIQLGVSPLIEPTEYDFLAFECTNLKADFTRFAKPTYWPGLDLIASTPSLFYAGMYIDNKLQSAIQNNQEWDKFGFISLGLTKIKHIYDAIIIDTAASTDLLTQSATLAANFLLIPVAQTQYGFAATIEYLQLYDDLLTQASDVIPELMNTVEHATADNLSNKTFDLVELIESNSEANNRQHALVGALLQDAFPHNMCPVALPHTVKPADPLCEDIGKFVDHIAAELQVAWGK